MADQQNNIAITVTDSVAASIETKILGIAAAALSADGIIKGLQASLGSLDASGVTSAATAMRGASTASGVLAGNVARLTSAAAAAAPQISALAASCGALETQATAAAVGVAALAAATAAMAGQSRGAVAASQQVVNTTNNLTRATTGASGGLRGMTSILRVAEGGIGGANRSAAGFLTTLLGGTGIMEAAFAVAGPIALVAVLGEVYQAVEHVVEAYHDMQHASIVASNQAIDDGNKVQKVKAASIFSAAGIANLFTDSPFQQTISVVQVQAQLKEIETAKTKAAADAQVNEAGLQGVALNKQQIADSQLKSATIQKEIDQVKKLHDAYRAQSEETVSVTTPGFATRNRYQPAVTTTQQKITDPGQQKALQTQISATDEALRQLNTELYVTDQQTVAIGKRQPLAGLKDEARAASAAMKAINDELARMKSGNSFVTAQQTLSLYTSHKNDLPGNKVFKDDIDSKIGGAQQTVNSQNDKVGASVTTLLDQARNVGAYSDALKIQQNVEKEVTALEREHITVTDDLRATYTALNTYIVTTAGYQAELTTQYNAANGPLKTYTDASAALFRLYADGAITGQAWERQTNLVTEAYQKATQPFLELSRQLSDATALQGKYGSELQVATQVQQQLNEKRQAGITLSAQEQAQLHDTLANANAASQVNQDLVGIYDAQAGALQRLVTQQQALNAARQASIGVDSQHVQLSQQTYQAMTAQNQVAQDQLAVNNNTASVNQRVIASLGGILEGYKGLSQGANASMGTFFKTLDSGFADAIGRAIVFGQSFSSSVMDVARQAVSGLISSLVKLGIQWVITEAIGATLGASAAAVTATTAAATAVAWAPAAAFASLATLGANAAPADAAIATTTALTLGLAAFRDGGPVLGAGTSTSDSIPALLSNGEYVINASAYNRNKAAVEAINAGQTVAPSSINQASVSGRQGGSSVEVHNYSGSAVQVQHMDDDRVRLIIGQEVPGHIARQAPAAVAATLSDANSPMSKSMYRNITPQRSDR